jgi:hypothetical protein
MFRSKGKTIHLPAGFTSAHRLGPQGKEITAVLIGAETLTNREAGRMAAVRDRIWRECQPIECVEVWNSAATAASAASREDARGAVFDVIQTAEWYSAEPSVRDAVWGLLVRDLRVPRGCQGFPELYYDLLTGPWRSVMGRLHPDDEVLS